MLDRKEEHLDTGNRPSATAHIRAGVTADGTLTAFDGQSWGTGGAGARRGFPLPYIYNFPNRKRTHKDVYINAGQQRAMRAPGHPQGCFLTEILMDELADRVKMDPVAFRVKNLPPAAPNAMWAEYFARGAKAFGWDKRHADRRSDAGPDQDRHGRVGAPVGRRRPRLAGAHGHHVRRRRRDQVRHAGHRHRRPARSSRSSPPKRSACRSSAVKPEIGDTMLPFSGGSGGSTTAASAMPAHPRRRR